MNSLEHVKESLALAALVLLRDIQPRIIFSILQNDYLSMKIVK